MLYKRQFTVILCILAMSAGCMSGQSTWDEDVAGSTTELIVEMHATGGDSVQWSYVGSLEAIDRLRSLLIAHAGSTPGDDVMFIGDESFAIEADSPDAVAVVTDRLNGIATQAGFAMEHPLARNYLCRGGPQFVVDVPPGI